MIYVSRVVNLLVSTTVGRVVIYARGGFIRLETVVIIKILMISWSLGTISRLEKRHQLSNRN